MPNEFTPAEQAAALALSKAATARGVRLGGLRRPLALAAVAAVRGPMYAELSARVEEGIKAEAEEQSLLIAAISLEEAATAWTDEAHTYQGTNAALWLRDRAAALRSTEKGTNQ